jgi:YD repeat-containing protein
METHSADDRVKSKQYQVYNTIGCLTVTKTKIGDSEEQTMEQQSHYKSWDKEITEENGVMVKREYFDDGNLKKETLIASDNSQIIVYQATRDSAGEYIRQETGSFDTKTYTYLDFSLDKLERSCYNGNTYKETYEYDAYREQLEKLTAYDNNTQKAQNVMTYEEGELSTATDSKSKYKFDYDKATDTSTFGVYQGTTLKTLEKQVFNANANTVTHTYYRNGSSTPSDTFVYTTDDYGRLLKESYNGTDMVTYGYTNGAESPVAQKLSSVVDGYNGKVYGYGYYADGTLGVENVNRVNVVDATTGEIELVEEFKAERLNESSKKYTIGTDTLKQTATQDARLKKLENAFNDTVVNVFSKEYEYDKFGRMTGKKLPDNASVLTLGYADTHMLPVSETYKRGSTTEYTATYGYDGRGNITSVASTNGTTTYEYDTLNRLKKEINGE